MLRQGGHALTNAFLIHGASQPNTIGMPVMFTLTFVARTCHGIVLLAMVWPTITIAEASARAAARQVQLRP